MVCGEELGKHPSPTHAARAGWTHRALSLPEDRGAEQRGVDGPLECTLALGVVASEARLHVAGQHAAGTLPWVGASSTEETQRLQETPRGQEKLSKANDPRHTLQEN